MSNAQLGRMLKALNDIQTERMRQIDKGYSTDSKDDGYRMGQLAGAAACYAMVDCKPSKDELRADIPTFINRLWPWAKSWWNPDSPRENLIKAGALIVAELERLERKEQSK